MEKRILLVFRHITSSRYFLFVKEICDGAAESFEDKACSF